MADFLKRRKITKEEYLQAVATLTPFEYRLYEETIKGYRMKEAAKRLKLKNSAADSCLKDIFKKLDVYSVVEMILTYGPVYNVINNNE